jgi:NhaP-type Na+/H+ and K+/H+ antiporter
MTKRNITVLTAILIGTVVAFCLAAAIASTYWFNTAPSLSELQEATLDFMTLTEAEADRLSQLSAVGLVIDFTVNLILYVCPSMGLGAIIGLIGGILWYKRRL